MESTSVAAGAGGMGGSVSEGFDCKGARGNLLGDENVAS